MLKKKVLAGLMMSACLSSIHAEAESIWSALKGGTPTVQLRLRYEDVSDDTSATGAKDVQDLTLRTAIGYKTGTYMGLSAYAQLEDISMIDDNDKANADARASELNQAFLKYGNSDFETVLGRQTLIYDNARHIGNVGWRQNDQTFDAATLKYTKDKLSLNYNYVWQANRITNTQQEMSSHLVNAAYDFKTIKVVGYYYLLDFDTGTTNFFTDTHDTDTYGIRLAGAAPVGATKLLYTLEYALQSDGSDATVSFDADYILAELGASFSGVTIKGGYEVLGVDNGVSFSTPLATVHAFNGWSDKVIAAQLKGNANGIEDTYFAISGKVVGIALLGMYHDIKPETGTSATIEGSEIDLQATYATKVGFTFGAKAAFFDADAAANDLDKFWLWTEYKI